MVTMVMNAGGNLRFLGLALSAFLDAHVPEFAGFEDLAALQALHKLGVLFAAYDLHARMFARLLAGVLRVRERL
jgi:hypothetical protein